MEIGGARASAYPTFDTAIGKKGNRISRVGRSVASHDACMLYISTVCLPSSDVMLRLACVLSPAKNNFVDQTWNASPRVHLSSPSPSLLSDLVIEEA